MAMYKPGKEPMGAVSELQVEGEVLVQRSPANDGFWITVDCDKYLPFVQAWLYNSLYNVGIVRAGGRRGRNRDGETSYEVLCNGVAVINGDDIVFLPDDDTQCIKQFDRDAGNYISLDWKDE